MKSIRDFFRLWSITGKLKKAAQEPVKIEELERGEVLPYLAFELFQLVRQRRGLVGEAQIVEWVMGDHEEGSDLLPSPIEVVIRHVWDDLKVEFVDWPIQPKFVEGRLAGVGLQKHWWYEISEVDVELDPIPRVFIIDPAPIGIAASVLMVEPHSPFGAMYKKEPVN